MQYAPHHVHVSATEQNWQQSVNRMAEEKSLEMPTAQESRQVAWWIQTRAVTVLSYERRTHAAIELSALSSSPFF